MTRNMEIEASQIYQGFLEQIAASPLSTRNALRVEIDFPAISPLQWLSGQGGNARYYWRNRERNIEMAGIGESDIVIPETEIDAPGTLINRIRSRMAGSSQNLRYYGGFRFHTGKVPNGRWHDFKAYRFVLPLLELCHVEDRYTLACNLTAGHDRQSVMRTLRDVSFRANANSNGLPAFSRRSDLPSPEGWERLVNDGLSAIASNTLEKVVLARQSTFQATHPIDPVALTQRLAVDAQGAYLFCFEPASSRAFLGASPECLFKRDNNAIYSEALAGTRPRGDTDGAERAFEQELLQNAKENREHQYVVEEICRVLRRFCTHIDKPEAPKIMKLSRCQHLHTPITGALRQGADDALLLEALHPTPAVGGVPQKNAVRWILENEPFERGIYAAPVGWVSADAAEFSVAIRSGLVREDRLTLYSGAGIIAGARPEDEWRELDAKLASFLAAIMKEA